MEKMNRKEFFVLSARVGGCCGAALLSGALPLAAQDSTVPDDKSKACDRKVKQGQDVIKRILNQINQRVDPGTRDAIMENCGRLCFASAHPETKKPSPEESAKFLEKMKGHVGRDSVLQKDDTTQIHFRFQKAQNTGKCLCLIMEDAPKDISPEYCRCSIGYVKAMFEQGLDKPVAVELTDSVLRGGKSCNFVIRFKTA